MVLHAQYPTEIPSHSFHRPTKTTPLLLPPCPDHFNLTFCYLRELDTVETRMRGIFASWPQRLWCICPLFLVTPCCSQGATLHVTLQCRPVVCFFFKFFFYPNFFSPPKFSHFHFFAFLDVSCHPECSKKIHKMSCGCDTMIPSILV